ncbi:hypothetical protein PROFUN_08872 [Planoprotostelium fungivorum]|uniref:DDE Tnp4 domain-containing protein n=1 Tax=Planoprotostelium fungivorum TaxID=1890364 RepID=A0A2P6NJ01_9EUKA|nr:hypothetical protein PROFUN_08872 [Planoprotostelium fungivorum]
MNDTHDIIDLTHDTYDTNNTHTQRHDGLITFSFRSLIIPANSTKPSLVITTTAFNIHPGFSAGWLAVAFMYIKGYPTLDQGTIYGMSSRQLLRVVRATVNLLHGSLRMPDFSDRHDDQTMSLESDEGYGAIDCTLCPASKPNDWAVARRYYSAKHKMNGIKYEVKCLLTPYTLLRVADCMFSHYWPNLLGQRPSRGSIHDLQVARNSGFYRKAYNIFRMTGLKIYGDAGYQGASWAILPFTERYGEIYNYAHSGRRIIVEQVFHRLKSYRTLTISQYIQTASIAHFSVLREGSKKRKPYKHKRLAIQR